MLDNFIDAYVYKILFTFGSGILLIVLSSYIKKFNTLFALIVVGLSLSVISSGVIAVLEKRGIVDESSTYHLIPLIGILFVPISVFQLTEDKAIRKVAVGGTVLLLFSLLLIGAVALLALRD